MIEILPFGDHAVLVNFKQEINLNIHQQVLGLKSFLEQKDKENQFVFIPTYASLTIIFQPKMITFEALKELVLKYKPSQNNSFVDTKTKIIPVCFDPVFALDKNNVEEHLKKDFIEIIDLFCYRTYSVFQLGFLPGFAYLGTLNTALNCPRKSVPRSIVPAQSLGIAGLQAGIYPSDSPAGWQIIGKTPYSLFKLQRANPFLLEVGMTVQFEPITLSKFKKLYG